MIAAGSTRESRPAGDRPSRTGLRPVLPALRTAAGLGLALLVLTAGPVGARSQEAETRPLTKSELVRLLVDSSLGPAEIAAVVERACLTFEPDDTDYGDLEKVGAGPKVLGAVKACAREPVRVVLSSSRRVVRPGDTVLVVARAARGNRPAPGQRIVLREGDTRLNAERTDDRGQARFRITADTGVGERTLRFRAASPPRGDGSTLQLEVRGGPGAAAESEGAGSAAAGTASTPSDTGTTDRGREARETAARGDSLGTGEVHVYGQDVIVRGGVEEGDSATAKSGAVPPAAREALKAGRDALARGDLDGASRHFRTALEGDAPGAREGLGRVALARHRPLRAARWFEEAVRRTPGDGGAWGGLGWAWLGAGEPARAREAFLEGRRTATDPEVVRRAVDRVGGLPSWACLAVEGGGGWRGPGLRGLGRVAARMRPDPAIGVWAEFADSFKGRFRGLTRGGGGVTSLAGGVELSYGPGGSLSTRLAAGRLDHGSGLIEFVHRVRQEVRFTVDGRPLRWWAGGTLARWWDRDDWLLSTGVEFPLSPVVALRPSLHYGETSGTPTADRGRTPARERRGELAVPIGRASEWTVVPTLAFGRMTPLDGSDGGSLLEGRLHLTAPLGPSISFLLDVRHQRPPFGGSFTDVAAGLSYGLR